ncbi:MAG: nucleotide pyrophosphohydrolase [Gammaproteobacteria bacterium]|nr:nucleotide pyrophosphohydrolase [Gammaproteobacteria bacterium]
MTTDSLKHLNTRLLEFAREREWEQFHSPKNLAMALVAEGGELMEHFQWLTQEQSYQLSDEKHDQVALEMADILIYLIRCAERLDIDLIEAANHKISINEERFSVEKVKGRGVRGEEI